MEQTPFWAANRPSTSKEIPAFYGNRRFITAFTSARHLSLSCARSIQFLPTTHFLKTFPIQAPNIPCNESHIPFPFLRWYQSIKARSTCLCYVTMPVLTVKSCQHLAQPSSWRTTPRQPSATAYSIYSQLPSTSSDSNPRTRHAVLTGTHLSWFP